MKRNLSVYISTPFFAALGRLGGMIIPLFIAYFYGVSYETDAFFFSYTFVFFLGTLFQQIFETALIPHLTEYKKTAGTSSAAVAFKVAAVIVPAAVLLSLGLGFGLKMWLGDLSGFPAEVAPLAAQLFFEMIPFLVFLILASAVNGVCNAHHRYWYPALSPLIRSLFVLAVMFLFHGRLGIHAITLGLVSGECVRWILSLLVLRDLNKHDRKTPEKPVLSSVFWRDTLLQMFALMGIQMGPLVNQWFVSWLNAGDVTIMGYADRLAMIPSQIYLAGISQIFLSRWSESSLDQHPRDFRRRVIQDSSWAVGLAASASVVLWLLRYPLSSVAFGRGDFPPQHLQIVAETFGLLMLGFAPGVLISLNLRIFYIFRKPVILCLQSWGRLVLQAALCFWLAPQYGVKGVAASVTVSTLISAVILIPVVERIWAGRVRGAAA